VECYYHQVSQGIRRWCGLGGRGNGRGLAHGGGDRRGDVDEEGDSSGDDRIKMHRVGVGDAVGVPDERLIPGGERLGILLHGH
jgi:hypothetical protein